MDSEPQSRRVAVLGASSKPSRYSNQAIQLLAQFGYEVVPIHPALDSVHGIPVTASLEELIDQELPISTLTIYLRPELTAEMGEAIVRLKPKRVIFNPGTESSGLVEQLEEAGIAWRNSCTLVLLRSGQF